MSPLITLLARLLTDVNPCENTQIIVKNPLDLFSLIPYNNHVRVQKHLLCSLIALCSIFSTIITTTSEDSSHQSMTFRFSWMVLETLVENSIRILRECPHSITSRRSDGAGNVLTTMLLRQHSALKYKKRSLP